MKLAVHTICPRCRAAIGTPYILLGVEVECPACGRPVIPEVPVGTTYPVTGYEITFGDFCQLLGDPSYRPHVLPSLREWFGCEVSPAPGGFSISQKSGEPMRAMALHQAIQADSSKQYALYQTAMSLWR